MLRLLVVGDLHGEERLLESLRARLAARGAWPDLLLFVGDFGNTDPRDFASEEVQLEEMAHRTAALQRMREIAPDCFYVGGNHDPFLLWAREPGEGGLRALQEGGRIRGEAGGDLHGRAVRLAEDLVLVGLGGATGFRDDAGGGGGAGIGQPSPAGEWRPREAEGPRAGEPAPAEPGPAKPDPAEPDPAAPAPAAASAAPLAPPPELRERAAALLRAGYPFEALGQPRPCFDAAALGLEPGPARCRLSAGYPYGPFLPALLPLGPRAPGPLEAREAAWLGGLAQAGLELGEREGAEALAGAAGLLLEEGALAAFAGAEGAPELVRAAQAALPQALELLSRANYLANCALQRVLAGALGSPALADEVRARLPAAAYRLEELGLRAEPWDSVMARAVLAALDPGLLREEERRELDRRGALLALPGREARPPPRPEAPLPVPETTQEMLWGATQEAAALAGQAAFFAHGPSGAAPLRPGRPLAEMEGGLDSAGLRRAYELSARLAREALRPWRLCPGGPRPFDPRRDAVVLLSHQGAAGCATSLELHPAGARLREMGSFSLRALYEDPRLDLLLHVHGHAHHPSRGAVRLGRTVAVNPGKLESRAASLVSLGREGGRWRVLCVEEVRF